MNRNALLGSACLLLVAGAALAGEPDSKCCFKNVAYSGVCEATRGADETCASILGYLNTPNSAGKSYCGGTEIRGGWESVSCKPHSLAAREQPERRLAVAVVDAEHGVAAVRRERHVEPLADLGHALEAGRHELDLLACGR